MNSDSEGQTTNSNQKRRVDSENYSDVEDEFSLSLHDSDTEEECSTPAKIPKVLLSEAEKRQQRNIEERERLWEQQKDKYENMFK